MNKNEFLKNVFRTIKKDNLEEFKKLTNNNKLINFKNKQKENLLFYSLQSGSINISQYIIESSPDLLLERNSFYLTPFSDLIYRDNKKGFNAFLQLSNIKNLPLGQIYEKGGEVYTIPLLAVEKLSKENWLIFEDLTKKFWNEKTLSAKDRLGYNIAHKIAINNSEYAQNILDYLPKSIFSQLDSEMGSTPFLTAVKFSSLPLIKKILSYSDINQTTLLGSNAVHLSIFNEDPSVLDFILKELEQYPETITSSNLYGDSSIMSAINNDNFRALETLLPYYINQKKDLSEEIIHFIKTSPKNFDYFKKFMDKIYPENLSSLLKNEEYTGFLFSYIFHYGTENDIKEMEKSFYWQSITNIKNSFLNHQLYSSSILGKKSSIFKVNYLLNLNKKILTSLESQKVFTHNNEVDLLFYNEDYQLFNKHSKISSFVSSLNTMPASQLLDLLKKTNIHKSFDYLDNLFLLTIGLRKKNKDIIELVNIESKNEIKSHFNSVLNIQDLLTTLVSTEEFNPYFSKLITHLDINHTRLFHNYIDDIFNANNKNKLAKIYNVLSLFSEHPSLKKDFIHLLIYRLTQTNENQNDLLNLFVKNDKAVLSAIEVITDKQINKLKDNNFTKHILSVYGDRKNLIDFFIKIARSSNIHKHDIMNFMLPKCILNNSTSKKLAKDIENNPIDNYGWLFIFKNFPKNNALNILTDSYFSSKSNFNEFSIDILENINYFSSSAENCIYNCFKNFNGKDNLDIIDFLLAKTSINYEIIIKDCFDNKNFHPISYLIKKYKININDLKINQFWENLEIDNFFIDFKNDNQFHSNSLNNYFSFLEEHKNNISLTELHKISENFYFWLEKNDTNENNIAIIRIINVFLKTFNDRINELDENILLKICTTVLKNNELNDLFVAKKEYENIFDIVFKNKEYDDNFFKKINNNQFFIENKNKLPEEQLRRLSYYSMKDKFSVSESKPNKTIKI